MYYAQTLKSTGPLVIMIFEIVWDMRYFLLSLTSIMIGFGVAFFVLFRHDHESSDVKDNFGRVDQTLIRMFAMMLGDFDVEVFYESNRAYIALPLFILYMIIMMIVLLNLLIAIMGDSFDRVKSNEELFFMKARASVIDDVESMLSKAKRRQLE